MERSLLNRLERAGLREQGQNLYSKWGPSLNPQVGKQGVENKGKERKKTMDERSGIKGGRLRGAVERL